MKLGEASAPGGRPLMPGEMDEGGDTSDGFPLGVSIPPRPQFSLLKLLLCALTYFK